MAQIKEILHDVLVEDDEHEHDYDNGGFGHVCACGREETPDETDERLRDIEDDRAFEAWREDRMLGR